MSSLRQRRTDVSVAERLGRAAHRIPHSESVVSQLLQKSIYAEISVNNFEYTLAVLL
jgi:hypothetical protein